MSSKRSGNMVDKCANSPLVAFNFDFHEISNGCRCNKAVIVWFSIYTGDNPLAKARGLSSRTYAQTIQ